MHMGVFCTNKQVNTCLCCQEQDAYAYYRLGFGMVAWDTGKLWMKLAHGHIVTLDVA